jgi:hypothetical protein
MMTVTEAVATLRSNRCGGCGKKKGAMQSFCFECYRLLPDHMQRALYRRVGSGYEAAHEEARRCIAQRRETASEVRAGRHTKGHRS